jgi:hypothetical protein
MIASLPIFSPLQRQKLDVSILYSTGAGAESRCWHILFSSPKGRIRMLALPMFNPTRYGIQMIVFPFQPAQKRNLQHSGISYSQPMQEQTSMLTFPFNFCRDRIQKPAFPIHPCRGRSQMLAFPIHRALRQNPDAEISYSAAQRQKPDAGLFLFILLRQNPDAGNSIQPCRGRIQKLGFLFQSPVATESRCRHFLFTQAEAESRCWVFLFTLR